MLFSTSQILVVERDSQMRILLLAVLTASLSFGIDKLCCPCSSGKQRFVAQTAIGSSCSIACSSNRGEALKEPAWTVNSDASCGLTPPNAQKQEARPANLDSVRHDAWYVIHHQAATIWVGGEGSTMRRGEDLRYHLTHDKHMDVTVLSAAPVAILERATAEAVAQCLSEQQREVQEGFVWVCQTQRRGDDIRASLASGNFDGIRSIFSTEESHVDTLRNRIYCRDNAQIADLVRHHCPAPQPKPTRERVGKND